MQERMKRYTSEGNDMKNLLMELYVRDNRVFCTQLYRLEW